MTFYEFIGWLLVTLAAIAIIGLDVVVFVNRVIGAY